MFIKEIEELIEKSPTGSYDESALQKLGDEYKELEEEKRKYLKGEADEYDLMLELADIVYYCFKIIIFCGLNVGKLTGRKFPLLQLFSLCVIKYSTRQKNKKNPQLERQSLINYLN